MPESDLCLGEHSDHPPLWAVFRGNHFLQICTHPTVANLFARSKKDRVVEYRPVLSPTSIGLTITPAENDNPKNQKTNQETD